jgi:serine/threonine protein phosphatase 1
MITHAIGDVHGRADLLRSAFDWIADQVTSTAEGTRVILLGDLIDRGPASMEVIDLVLAGIPETEIVVLRGNHEQMMLDALRNPRSIHAAHWIKQGGIETLMSYGWRPEDGYDVSCIPADHLNFINSLPLFFEDETRFFVHAGMRPGLTPGQQDPDDFIWIREDFLFSDWSFGKIVVHGHTPNSQGPEIRENRINLDVFAYKTGRLAIATFRGPAPLPRITFCEPKPAPVFSKNP